MQFTKKQKVAAVLGGGAVAVAGAGIAFAAWTTTGTGSGTATAGTDSPLTVAGTAVTGLYPTGSFPVTITVTNPNPYAVALSTLPLDTAGITVDTDHSTCNVSSVSYTPPADLTAQIPAKSGSTSGSQTFTGTVAMSNAALDACKGAVFTLNLKANGASAVASS